MKKIKIQLKSEELRKKLNLRDGRDGVDGKDGVSVKGEKGEKGDRGVDGKTPDVTTIIKEAQERAVEAVAPLIPKIEDIEKNIPILGESIRDSLELLTGDERLDKSAIKGLEDFIDKKVFVGGGSTARNFYQLMDVPQNYASQSGKSLRVKSDETGLEFYTPVSSLEWGDITGTLSDQTDLQAALDAKFTLPSLTAGSVLFSNGSTIAQDNTNFFWDDSNNRLILSIDGGTRPSSIPSTVGLMAYATSGGNSDAAIAITGRTVGGGTSTLFMGHTGDIDECYLSYGFGTDTLSLFLGGSSTPNFAFVGAADVNDTQFGWGFSGALASTDTLKLGRPGNGSFKYINLESAGFGTWNHKIGWSTVSSGSDAVGHITFSNVVSNTNDVEVMRIKGDKLGIGTTNPSTRLHSVNSASFQGQFSGYSPVGGADTNNGAIIIGASTSFRGEIHYDQSFDTTWYFDNTYDQQGGAIQFRFRTAGTPVVALSLKGTGGVGIGELANNSYSLTVTNSSLPARFYGWNSISGANSANGELLIGASSGNQAKLIAENNATYADTILLQTYDNNDGRIVLRTRTAGTAVDGLILAGDGKGTIRTGLTTSARAALGGTLVDHYADAGNVGTGEDDLYSDTLAASTLGTNGDKIVAQYGLTFVSSATATRQVRAYFGGTLILDTGTLTFGSAGSADVWITVIRESSSVVRCTAEIVVSGLTLQPISQYTRITGLTLTNTQVLKITGEAAGAGAATDDIVAKMAYVEWKSAA